MTENRAYPKDCDFCGRRISMRFMAWSNETWLPFDYDTYDRHDCQSAGSGWIASTTKVKERVLHPGYRHLVEPRWADPGPVQGFVDGMGTSIVDMQPGTFRDAVVARAPFTLCCDDAEEWFTIDGGGQPALVVDAGDAVVTFRGVRFVSTSPLGAVVVLSGGVHLEGCLIEAGSLGVEFLSGRRTSQLVDTDIMVEGDRARGIHVAAGSRLRIRRTSVSGTSLRQLDVESGGTVDGWLDQRAAVDDVGLTVPANLPPIPADPPASAVSARRLLSIELQTLAAAFHRQATDLLDSLDAIPDGLTEMGDRSRVQADLEGTLLAIEDLQVRLEPMIESA